jgi:hypothetical protein
MIRRVASHYIFWHHIYKLHYVELDEDDCFLGIYPLEQEIENTKFYDGILILSLPEKAASVPQQISFIKGESMIDHEASLTNALAYHDCSTGVEIGSRIALLLLEGVSLTATELRTDNRSCNGYIKRL